MKKDLDKLFSKSIETYYFLLLIVVIIKLLGGNYFAIVYTNKTVTLINDFITTWKLENIWYAVTLYVNVYIVASFTININNKSLKKYILCCFPIIVLFQCIKGKIGVIGLLLDYTYLVILPLIYMKIKNIKITKENIFNYILIMIIVTITQIFSMMIRDRSLDNVANGLYTNIILNLDYFLILLIIHKLYFYKGGKNLCQVVVSFGLQKLTSLKNLPKRLQTKSQKTKTTKTKSKEEKITKLIYIPLYTLWNLFTMLIIILIACLNDAFIEALFITFAFWFNKFAFGKPFHFKSVAVCFGFSSITYYVLTRVTFSTETSFLIPIFLGVALSFVTSHFIKKNTNLYKGIPEQELIDIVKQVEDNVLTIKILKEYYCDRLDDRVIARNNNYSIDTIRKIRQRVNKKLRNLL